jgi:phosphoribosylamine---glycine ligase
VRILVVGSGGREHAIAMTLHRGGAHEVICAPGNPGMAAIGACHAVDPVDAASITALARASAVDLVVIGPEAPLAAGLSDVLRGEGIPAFGPGASGARMESSKWFSKEIMKLAGVPTPDGRHFDSPETALSWMGTRYRDWVIKADALAAGKGVYLPASREEAVSALGEIFSGASGRGGVVIERRLSGREASIMAVCSGNGAVLLPPSRDHKRAFDGDRGPNTGGMGAVCPPPDLPPGFASDMLGRVVLPVLDVLGVKRIDYRGVLYAGLMVTDDGPFVLEFNCRLGDPETQAVLPLVEDDLAEVMLGAATGGGVPESIHCRSGAAACVVLASGGYPGSYSRGLGITGLDSVHDALVFHAGTAMDGDRLVTAGGRVLGVTGMGEDLPSAIDAAYGAASLICFEGCHYRHDIGRVT